MWLARLTDNSIRLAVVFLFIIFILTPHLLLHLVGPGLIRPVFFAASQVSLCLMLIVGLYGGFTKLYLDPTYKSTKHQKRPFLALSIIVIILIPIVFVSAYRHAVDLIAYTLEQAPLRTTTATLVERNGYPLSMFYSDTLVLASGKTLYLPYSDGPKVGETYTFTLMPTEDIIVYYVPALHP